MNLIARGTMSLPGNQSWQIPLGLFYVVPTVVTVLIWFIPEVCIASLLIYLSYSYADTVEFSLPVGS